MYITSNNYAAIADTIYSQTISTYKKIDLKNKIIVNETNNQLFNAITYKKTNFEISDESIIYCDSDLVSNLFKILKNYKDLKNITLVTSQSDTGINENIYSKKPNCITNWYSSNVEIDKLDLEPIPLGISNNFSKKNITENDFLNIPEFIDLSDKYMKMYVNFNVNTNIKERAPLYDLFKNKEWCTVENVGTDNKKYIETIKKYSFVLCPWGNGVETHRVWESLYLGSIPITKYHYTYKNCRDLPILFVNSYDEINLEMLESFKSKLKSDIFNLDKLKIEYWEDFISSKKLSSSNMNVKTHIILETNISIKINKLKNSVSKFFNSKFKIFKFYMRKFLKLKKILRF